MQTLVILVVAVGIAWLALRYKFRRDGIYQRGVRVGSALAGSMVTPESTAGQFVIIRGQIRGTAFFHEREPFTHRGIVFSIVHVRARDERSDVLLRLLDVTCRVESHGRYVSRSQTTS